MPYCPECFDEFQDWVKVCPDCGVALVEELPEGPEPGTGLNKDEPLVHVATAPNPIIGAMWKGILENEGIYSLLGSGNLQAAQYILVTDFGSDIYVLSSHEQEAKKILAPFIEKALSE